MFDLNEELNFLNSKEISIINEVEISLLNNKQRSKLIKELDEYIQQDSSTIISDQVFDQFKSLLKSLNLLNNDHLKDLSCCLLNAFEKQISISRDFIQENNQEKFEFLKHVLQHYLFLWYWLFDAAENELTTTVSLSKKTKSSKKDETANAWDPKSAKDPGLKGMALDTIHQFLLLNLDLLFVASSDRDLVINDMIFKSIRLSLESPESLKASPVKTTISDIFCHCANKYETTLKVITNHLQDFLREDHLCEFVAEILDSSIVNYQDKKLVEFILKFVGSRLYSDKDQDKLSKSTSKFLFKFSELQPKESMKHMVQLNDLLDSESPTIRAIMMEVIANIIHGHLVMDDSEIAATNIKNFYEILSQRFLDTAPLVRTRVMKVLIKLTQRHTNAPGVTDIPLSHRQELVNNAVKRLKDKSSLVRKKAIELVMAFIESSPFFAIPQDMGSLSQARFENHVERLINAIKGKMPKEFSQSAEEATEEGEQVPEAPQPELSEAAQLELKQLQSLLKYYQDALEFSKSLNSACDIVVDVLSSTLKTEVTSAMKFFVTAHRYDLEKAKVGVRKMVHKIWDKDTGDNEAGSIREHLISCFYDIHMNPPESPISEEKLIADNLVDLIGEMDLSELTSLEELMATMSSQSKIPDHLADTLWAMFSSKGTSVSLARKKNALVLLGMIGKSNKNIIGDNLDVLTRIGLGSLAQDDLIVAKYACLAIQQLYHVRRQKGVYTAPLERKTADHPTCERICALLLNESSSNSWFSFAEQGLNAIYIMIEQPDRVCEDLIKKLTSRVFGRQSNTLEKITSDLERVSINSSDQEVEKNGDVEMEVDENIAIPVKSNNQNHSFALAQLLFLVGHVAIKQIVHLECIESEWKRRKNSKDKDASVSQDKGELEMVTGSAEDEFCETVAMVREHELLFGPNSLLSMFGPILVHVLTHLPKFRNPILQIMAGLSMCKFMCISSTFCEAHLQLLFTIMERSNDPIMRSNLAIGMGDLAICFNSILDEHIVHLYNRLKDTDFYVKKNALMVLTFLILNGMIKIKGQISEMAKCVEDEDLRIRNLAKAFFKELSTKDNAIYNNLPDIISNLSSIEEDSYKSIVKFLFKFIVKEKQNESIVEKLCLRFKHADTERQWRDIGFCLSLLSFGTEKSLKKLIDHFSLYQDKLYEHQLFKHLLDIVAKMSKGKQEMKTLLDDFKERLLSAEATAIENHKASLAAQEGGKDIAFKDWKEYASESITRMSLPGLGDKREGETDETTADGEQEEDQEDVQGEEDKEASEQPLDNPVEKCQEKARDTDATITDGEEIVIPRKVKTPAKKPARGRSVKSTKTSKPKSTTRTARRAVVSDDDDDE